MGCGWVLLWATIVYYDNVDYPVKNTKKKRIKTYILILVLYIILNIFHQVKIHRKM